MYIFPSNVNSSEGIGKLDSIVLMNTVNNLNFRTLSTLCMSCVLPWFTKNLNGLYNIHC